MKKVIIVGFDYEYTRSIEAQYPDILFIKAGDIRHDTAERIIAIAKMADAILLLNGSYTEYMVAAVMLGKEVLHRADFPVTEPEGEGANNE